MSKPTGLPLTWLFCFGTAVIWPTSTEAQSNILLTELGPINSGFKFHKAYFRSNISLSWFDAWEFCREHDLHLVSVETSVESLYLHSLLTNESIQSYWTSGTDLGHQGKYFWMTSGNPVSYINWSSGQPDNAGGVQNCIKLWQIDGISAHWDDDVCTSPFNFICERFS